MPDPLRILIACETSGIARRAFAARGHDVWSCDLAHAEDGSNRHILCDVRGGILQGGWDLLCVMHKGKLSAKGSTATAYCWLVWLVGETGTKFDWIPPCRKRLERKSDYEAQA